MNLQSLLDNLITSGFRLSDPEATRKIRVLNSLAFIFILSAPLLGAFYLYIGARSLFYVTMISGLLMVSAAVLLRWKKNITLAGNYALLILWSTLLIISWNTGAISYGGVIGPSWVLNGGVILLALFFHGYLWATIWAILVFLETGLIIYFFRLGYYFPNLIPPQIMEVYSLGAYLLSLLAVLSFAFLFERERNEALSREEEKSQALKESKKYIDDVFDKSPIPAFILDKSHRVIQWNRACQEMTEVPASEILGKEVWDGFFMDGRKSLADIFLDNPDSILEKYGDHLASESENEWYELDLFLPKLKGGRRAVVTVAPIIDNRGGLRGAIQTIQSKNENPHEKDIENNGILSDPEVSFAGPVFRIDSHGKISFWNKACEETFGYAASDMLGKAPVSFVSKGSRASFKETIVGVFRGESFSKREWKYHSRDGKPVFVLAGACLFQAADAESNECVIIHTNITDLRVRVQRLELYAGESKEKLKNLSEEYELLRKNIATFIRGKNKKEGSPQ